MSFLPRAAALFGVAAGGVAAARAVAALTPEERAALAEVIQAGVELGRRGTARLGRRGREQRGRPPGPGAGNRPGPRARRASRRSLRAAAARTGSRPRTR